jgi:hypothetical protein
MGNGHPEHRAAYPVASEASDGHLIHGGNDAQLRRALNASGQP